MPRVCPLPLLKSPCSHQNGSLTWQVSSQSTQRLGHAQATDEDTVCRGPFSAIRTKVKRIRVSTWLATTSLPVFRPWLFALPPLYVCKLNGKQCSNLSTSS